jgi:hypothetical protein
MDLDLVEGVCGGVDQLCYQLGHHLRHWLNLHQKGKK